MSETMEVRELVSACLGRTGAPITALRRIVEVYGHIEESHIRIVSDVFNLSLADVRGIVSFYADLRTSPTGRRHIRICQAEACQSLGARALTHAVLESTGLALGEVSDNQEISLEGVYCLGLCASGPSAMVNERIVVRATKENLLA